VNYGYSDTYSARGILLALPFPRKKALSQFDEEKSIPCFDVLVRWPMDPWVGEGSEVPSYLPVMQAQ